jgi:folate-dependent phosphoribosylglycinamide formyltransferase PurN
MAKIKIGLLVNDFSIPNWLAEAVKEIEASDYAEITVIIRKKKQVVKQNKLRYLNIFKSLPLIIAYKLDQLIFKTQNDALAHTNILNILPNCTVIDVDTIETKHSDTITKESINQIKELHLDILFRAGFKILKGEVLTQASRLGVWSFHHGNNRYYRGTPACFWEVYQNNPTTGFILQQLSETLDGGNIIAQGNIPTINYSLNKTRQLLYWDAQGMLIVMLKEVYKNGIEQFAENKLNIKTLNIYDRPLYYAPTFLQGTIYLIKMLARWCLIKTNKYLSKSNKDWHLGWMNRSDQYSFRKIKKIIPPKNHFWADPFIVTFKAEELLFFEDYEYSKNKGRICYSKFDKNTKTFQNFKPVLETDYHLSFPATFIDKDNLYIIPETKSVNKVSLYLWKNESLEFKCDLIENINAVDTTLLFKDNKYWLFTSQQINSNGTIFHQHIYFADKLEGPYTPHSMNPIVDSSKQSRAAGNILKIGDNLYRTSQDCSKSYGQKIHLFKIEELTTTNYLETRVETIEANWDSSLKKIHTINQSDKIVIVDLYGKLKR